MTTIAQESRTPPISEKDYQTISDRRRILHILEELLRNKTFLTALPKNNAQAFTTALLDLDEDTNSLLLDEFLPEPGRGVLAPKQELWILGQMHGIKTAFQSQLIRLGKEDNIPYYVIQLPEKIRQQQRRNNYRVPVPLSTRNPVWLRKDAGLAFKAQLRDLSLGGVSVMMSYLKDMGDLSPGNEFEECIVNLPGESQIATSVEVRHVHNEAPAKTTRVGLAFRKLTPEDERRVQRSVAFLEREFLRKHPKQDD